MRSVLPSLSVCLFTFGAACGGAPGPQAPTAPARVASARPSETAAKAVRGRILDHAGQPAAEAWARVIGPMNTVEVEAKADAQGAFALQIDPAQRVRRVEIAAAGHKSHTILVATDALPVEVTVKLGTHAAPPGVKSVALQVSQIPNAWAAVKPLTNANGALDGDVSLPDGKYPFQVHGTGAGKSALLADGYATVTGGKTHVAFDLEKLPPPGVAAVVTFADPKGQSAGLTDVWAEYSRAHSAYRAAVMSALESGTPTGPVSASYPWTEQRRTLSEVARTNALPIVRQAASIAYFAEGAFAVPTADEHASAKKIVESVPPNDGLWWMLDARVFTTVATVAGEPSDGAYAKRFIETQPDVDALANFLVSAARDAKSDPTRLRALAAILKEPRFSRTFTARFALQQIDPDSPVSIGKPAPPFDVRALVGERLDANKRYTPKTLEKKLYLIDIWATWCKPCVAEMPQLHELYAKYGNNGKNGAARRLEILSVSIEGDPKKVAAFRKNPASPMPWLNAVTDDKETKALFGALGFEGDTTQVPFYILVDEQGTIVRASPDLGGHNLTPTVEKAIENASRTR